MMIVGNGLIANSFKKLSTDNQNVIIFASGVSNSMEKRKSEFLREKNMLINLVDIPKLIVYFSTCSIEDPLLHASPYVSHKQEMEELVSTAREFVIFRLPQVVGKTINPFTLTNYLYRQISTGSYFEVWQNATRNLIDVDDIALIVNYLIRSSMASCITSNIASPFTISVPDLVRIFESIIGRKSNCKFVDGGGSYFVDSTLAAHAATQAGVNFEKDYIIRVLKKYYG